MVKTLKKSIKKSLKSYLKRWTDPFKKLFEEVNWPLITFETYTVEKKILKVFVTLKTSALILFWGLRDP